jgi:hypothetical protein
MPATLLSEIAYFSVSLRVEKPLPLPLSLIKEIFCSGARSYYFHVQVNKGVSISPFLVTLLSIWLVYSFAFLNSSLSVAFLSQWRVHISLFSA